MRMRGFYVQRRRNFETPKHKFVLVLVIDNPIYVSRKKKAKAVLQFPNPWHFVDTCPYSNSSCTGLVAQ